jgi:hypothetical protein
LEEGVVSRRNGLDGKAANAGPGKNGFGDDGAGEESAELEAKDGDDGNEGVA